MTENEISYHIRGKIIYVYNQLGPGLLESAYSAVLEYELAKCGLNIKREVPVPLVYKNIKLATGYRIDLLIENKVLVEVKSIDQIHDVHHKQVITYLKLANLKLGLLVNFNTADIMSSIYRKVNGL